MNGGEKDVFIDAMKKYGRMYPDAGYGGRFGTWVFSYEREPYNSYGTLEIMSGLRTEVEGMKRGATRQFITNG